jgi:hypothetical protein
LEAIKMRAKTWQEVEKAGFWEEGRDWRPFVH